ncbi:MAG: SDR family oxidoreductase, partial [Bacteroidales bacterium]|nr:SDR family oxidoreductase [Bacteroidales bacterium]
MGMLEGKTALITGGGTGIGLAIAKRFYSEGAVVVIAGRRKDKLEQGGAVIAPDGKRVYSIQADVSKDEEAKKLIDATVAKTGRLDILVNNAGVMRFGTLDETPAKDWDLMM